MMQKENTAGLVLYSRNYREKDKLVKIFTESFGKRMFFVKNFAQSKYISSLQNFTSCQLLCTVNDNGFSFIDDVSQVDTLQHLSEDIFANAHASYLISLADAAISDNQYDPALYAFLTKSLQLIDEKFDKEIVTNIFEVQILNRFGISINFSDCQICHRSNLPMDFSYKYGGCLCPDHVNEDLRRLQLDPNVLYLLHQFQEIPLDQLEKIAIKPEMKKKLRLFIDGLYDEYVGIQLKSKKFLDSMDSWSDIMK